MFIDSHCHIPHKKYQMSAGDVILEANAEGVDKLICIGTSIDENEGVIELAEKYSCVYHTVGIYPHEDISVSIRDLETALRSQLEKSEKVVGIGECGIDISSWKGGRELPEQEELFSMQVELAKEYSLPVVIHNRKGDEHIFEVLESVGTDWLRGVSHCFSSTWETAQRFLDIGFYISFSGNITYKSGVELLETVKKVPLDRFVLETDAPYLPPEGYRGEPNFPKYVKIVAEKVAQVKQKSLDEIEAAAYENTCRLFSIL